MLGRPLESEIRELPEHRGPANIKDSAPAVLQKIHQEEEKRENQNSAIPATVYMRFKKLKPFWDAVSKPEWTPQKTVSRLW